MKRRTTTTRIALSMASLALSVLLTAHMLGVAPDYRVAVAEGRSALCESIAIHCSLMAEQGNVPAVEAGLKAICDSRPEIQSICLRREYFDAVVVRRSGEEDVAASDPEPSPADRVEVPIRSGPSLWGTVEVSFRSPQSLAWANGLDHPLLLTSAFFGPACFLGFSFLLSRILRQLDPSQVVPGRVRRALDTLAEGLLILDNEGRIVLANGAFSGTLHATPDALMGRLASELPWVALSHEAAGEPTAAIPYPWLLTIRDGQARTGVLIGIRVGESQLTFVCNTTPVNDSRGQRRGVFVSLENVTRLEEKKTELEAALERLRKHSDEIRRQNRELEELATHDPLTSCLNRRSFFDSFERLWKESLRNQTQLACVMMDVDHFKQVNDIHGHGAGDEVLKGIASRLRSTVPATGCVGRYGGEEFVVLLPDWDLDKAKQLAEQLRAAVEANSIVGLSVTVSLGVSARSLGAQTHGEMLEQADKSLYVAKRSGRNRVVAWIEVPDDTEFLPIEGRSLDAQPAEEKPTGSVAPIPYEAVSALMSALAYRDLETAEHSRRVADLCLAMAEGILSQRDCHLLENAALLHDIGKMGVPDSILLKPGRLTTEERQVLQRHKRIGVEIVRSSFGTPKLAEIIANAGVAYGGPGDDSAGPAGRNIPLGSRILAIADAFDSMVSKSVYRTPRTAAEALDELRRCSGTQFDPELTERLAECLDDPRLASHSSPPNVARQSALAIGRQIERLISALDSHDANSLKDIAGRVRSSAAKRGVNEVAEKAAQLEQAVETDDSLLRVLHLANELVDLCRLTQRSFLHSFREPSPPVPTTPSTPQGLDVEQEGKEQTLDRRASSGQKGF